MDANEELPMNTHREDPKKDAAKFCHAMVMAKMTDDEVLEFWLGLTDRQKQACAMVSQVIHCLRLVDLEAMSEVLNLVVERNAKLAS